MTERGSLCPGGRRQVKECQIITWEKPVWSPHHKILWTWLVFVCVCVCVPFSDSDTFILPCARKKMWKWNVEKKMCLYGWSWACYSQMGGIRWIVPAQVERLLARQVFWLLFLSDILYNCYITPTPMVYYWESPSTCMNFLMRHAHIRHKGSVLETASNHASLAFLEQATKRSSGVEKQVWPCGVSPEDPQLVHWLQRKVKGNLAVPLGMHTMKRIYDHRADKHRRWLDFQVRQSSPSKKALLLNAQGDKIGEHFWWEVRNSAVVWIKTAIWIAIILLRNT